MSKYMVLYYTPIQPKELMANANTEDMQASIDEWNNWKDNVSKSVKVEFGLPLQIIGHITLEGSSESNSQVVGYAIVKGDSKDEIMEILQTHPVLKRPDASIDLFEMISMPGIDA